MVKRFLNFSPDSSQGIRQNPEMILQFAPPTLQTRNEW